MILGRSEKAEEGIYMHCNGFAAEGEKTNDQFVFRQGRSRETSYARDYDNLFELLKYEREHGNLTYAPTSLENTGSHCDDHSRWHSASLV